MTEKCRDKPKHTLPEPMKITLPPKDYQPSKADMETAYDMPGASIETTRAAVFQPFNVRYEKPD